MQHGRLLVATALIVMSAFALTACSGDGSGDGDPVAGKRLFADNGCDGCHTFTAAGSKGTQGPDLDVAQPSAQQVKSQLRKPGGLMPSFAGKLSDDEMEDLAAFVGATNASGKAVVAAFEPDDKKLDSCGTNAPCIEQAFGNLTYNDGPKPALAELQKLSAANPTVAAQCHRITHKMGSAALARFDDKVAEALVEGTTFCFSGYYHGVIERAFLGQPPDKLTVLARQLCSDARIESSHFLLYQCIHGIGHGVMIYTGYDMPTSLKTCDGLQTGFNRVSCSGGVFMENFNSSYGVSSKFLRKDDPIYPCNAVADRHKQQCYGLVTANILRMNGYDQRTTVAACRRAEPRWVGMCFESFGRDASGIAGNSAAKALASCKLAGDYEGSCIYAVARDIVSFDAGAERAGRFCGRVPKQYASRCHVGLGSVLVSIEQTADRMQGACRKVSGRFAGSCMRGGGFDPAQQ